MFSCIYLIDIIACKVVGFYWTKEQLIKFSYGYDNIGQLYINLYHLYITLSNTIMLFNARIEITYLCGVYLLLKEVIKVDYTLH